MKMTTRKDIEQVLWNACDSFRGKIDSSRYKDYILSMLFVKYLSDVSKERREGYIKQYDGDMRRVERAMSRERFAMDEQSTFDYLYANRNDAEIDQKINDFALLLRRTRHTRDGVELFPDKTRFQRGYFRHRFLHFCKVRKKSVTLTI